MLDFKNIKMPLFYGFCLITLILAVMMRVFFTIFNTVGDQLNNAIIFKGRY